MILDKRFLFSLCDCTVFNTPHHELYVKFRTQITNVRKEHCTAYHVLKFTEITVETALRINILFSQIMPVTNFT